MLYFCLLITFAIHMVDSQSVDLGNGVTLQRHSNLLQMQIDPNELDLRPASLDIFCAQIEGRQVFSRNFNVDSYSPPFPLQFEMSSEDKIFCSTKATSISPVRTQYFEALIPAVEIDAIRTDDLVKVILKVQRGSGVVEVKSNRPWNEQLPIAAEIKLGLKFGSADPTVYRFPLSPISSDISGTNWMTVENSLNDSDSHKVVNLIRKTSCERVRICAQLRLGLNYLPELCQSSESAEAKR